MSRRPVSWSLHKFFKRAPKQAAEEEPRAAEEEAEPAPIVAVQPVPPPTPSWKEAAQREADEHKRAVASVAGADSQLVECAKPVTVRLNRGGRPKRGPGQPKCRYMSLTGQQKAWLAKEATERLQVPGSSRSMVFRSLAKQLGCSEPTVQRIFGQADFWINWAETAGRKASYRPGTNRKIGRNSAYSQKGKGCRKTGAGKKNPNKAAIDKVQMWAEAEQEGGHQLSRQDLLRHFGLVLDSQIAEARELQVVGALDPETARLLPHWVERQRLLKDSKKARDKYAKYLVVQTGWVERQKQRTTALTVEEEKKLCQEAWSYFDYVLWQTGCADAPDMAALVHQPERWLFNRQSTVITMSDQVPVWCRPDSGKRLVPAQAAQIAGKARARRRQQRMAGQQPGTEELEDQARTLVCAAGSPANSRFRLTLVARQLIHHYFDPVREPVGAYNELIGSGGGRGRHPRTQAPPKTSYF